MTKYAASLITGMVTTCRHPLLHEDRFDNAQCGGNTPESKGSLCFILEAAGYLLNWHDVSMPPVITTIARACRQHASIHQCMETVLFMHNVAETRRKAKASLGFNLEAAGHSQKWHDEVCRQPYYIILLAW